MSSNPLISIIIPVYNVEPYVSRCLNSIIRQSYANFEAIIVDDGSPDKSGQSVILLRSPISGSMFFIKRMQELGQHGILVCLM